MLPPQMGKVVCGVVERDRMMFLSWVACDEDG